MERTVTCIIPTGHYQGYIWLSDKEKPEIVDGVLSACIINSKSNPFIIEAQLYERNMGMSYSVRFTDGMFVFDSAQVVDYSDEHIFQASWDKGRKLKFVCEWKPKEDPLCENLPVYTPAGFYFVGFCN